LVTCFSVSSIYFVGFSIAFNKAPSVKRSGGDVSPSVIESFASNVCPFFSFFSTLVFFSLYFFFYPIFIFLFIFFVFFFSFSFFLHIQNVLIIQLRNV